jgi:hypothetical protein
LRINITQLCCYKYYAALLLQILCSSAASNIMQLCCYKFYAALPREIGICMCFVNPIYYQVQSTVNICRYRGSLWLQVQGTAIFVKTNRDRAYSLWKNISLGTGLAFSSFKSVPRVKASPPFFSKYLIRTG